ncbi:Acetyl-CoA hydrolase/transferase, C-terminal domain superfamily [Schizosaccharomyces osmophilus]|uniref:Acetyl-CoA hydrolase n=1 Tax=Schizosaccharomyces osmophilus TaxID=2545709 RepID=A0AAF0AVX3_9SCHI|nr:Acetyl-CoA hydrolase/transferase, C-terminal domain superfamily [Schizosaccharomyces osmophilus]WBW72918.1 Acetyl-CoA hydrolase/transferase, C-terminal domain superfamily [Schizosaccharomyces osmophilus]
MSSKLLSRVRCKYLRNKIIEPSSLLSNFQGHQTIGWSGFTGVDYPLQSLEPVINEVRSNGSFARPVFDLRVCSSGGTVTELALSELGMVRSRSPYQVSKSINKGLNNGKIDFHDHSLIDFAEQLTSGHLGAKDGKPQSLNIAIVEATEITEEGDLVPGASVGVTPELIQAAEKVIVEMNTNSPSLQGIHDLYVPTSPPYRRPLNVCTSKDRIGKTAIPLDPRKVVGIVEGSHGKFPTRTEPGNSSTKSISHHIIDFFKHETHRGRLPNNLHPIQSGIGAIANSVVEGLGNSSFRNLQVWTEVLQDAFLDLLKSGTVQYASSMSLRFSPQELENFYREWDFYKERVTLRPQAITNSPEIIRRLGCISLNTPVEVDLYGHVNSTCVMGSRMLNGIGGSGDFMRNAKLSIMHTPSVRPSKTDPTGISTIVPKVTHVDHTEHDIDIVVTEQGLADLRGLSPRERAIKVIKNCAHPVYRPILMDYFTLAESACLKRKMGHEPVLLDKAFNMHTSFLEKGSMKVSSW